jgi:hypothetical protein
MRWGSSTASQWYQSRTSAEELERLPTHWRRAEYCYDKMHKLRSKFYQKQREYEALAVMAQDHTVKGQPVEARRLIGRQRWSATEEAKEMIGLEQMWSRWASLECSMANLNKHPKGEHPQ